jgi:Zinc carboxypeptidase
MSLPPAAPPLTRAERTRYAETSLHADVMAFIDALAARRDPRLWIGDFGQSPEGRVLPLLVLSHAQLFTPEQAQAAGLPVVLVIAGIHSGEVEGKEGVLMFVRDVLDGHHGDLLSRVTLVVAPLFNPDGNDRISADNRALNLAKFSGQIGPAKVGTRGNAAGINLNRDYLRQEGEEMRLMQSRVCQPWNAHLTIDCHTTNGSIHRFAMTYDVPHTVHSGRREPIDYMREQLLPAVTAAVKRTEDLDSFWYGNFQRDEGGQGTGWITYTHHPRFGGNYRGLVNRLDLLLETYSYQTFDERVRTTYAFLRETLAYVAVHGAAITRMLDACVLPPQDIAVRYRLEAFDDRTAQILTREPYTLDGAPIAVEVPNIGRFVGEHVVRRPLAYAVPPDVGMHLERHGLQVQWPNSAPMLDAEVATVHAQASAAGRQILEAQASSHLEASYTAVERALPAGWALVPTEQQRGAVAVYLCEAGSDDGLVACGLVPVPAPGQEYPAWRVQRILT